MNPRPFPAALVLALAAAAPLSADWIEHKDKPSWLRRGAARMTNTFGDREKLPQWLNEDPMGFGHNVYYAIHWPWELVVDGTALANDYFRPQGGHLSWYICPTSMFWHDRIARLGGLPVELVG